MKFEKIRYVAIIFLAGCFISFPFLAQPANGETRYVSDILILSLREGPGNEYSVVRTLKSDMPLEVLEEESAFVKVRTETGEEGWVAKQYLTVNTPKSMIINQLNKEVAALNKKLEKLEEQRNTLVNRLDVGTKDHTSALESLREEVAKYKGNADSNARKLLEITKKYDTLANASQNVLAITVERDRLQSENETLKESNQNVIKKMEELGGENQRLMRNEILHWFLAGSGVFFLGLLTGKLTRKKKRY